MDKHVAYPFTHGIYQTNQIIAEFCELIENHPNSIIDCDSDVVTLKEPITILYNNRRIFVIEISVDTSCEYSEIPCSSTITFTTVDGISRKYDLGFVDAEFIELLMKSL